MSNERPDEYYVEKGVPGFTCCFCECDTATHACGWKCPIFNNELICSSCCLVDALRPTATKIFSEKLGRDITREEITKACTGCGRNNAVEDDALADKLVNNSFDLLKETDNGSENTTAG